MSGPLHALMCVIAVLNLLLVKTWSVWFVVLPSAEYHVCLWISSCGNVVLLTFKPYRYRKLNPFIPLLFVSLCKLSLPMVGLYMFSLPTFAVISPSIILMIELAIWFIFSLINYKILLLSLPFFVCWSVYIYQGSGKQFSFLISNNLFFHLWF